MSAVWLISGCIPENWPPATMVYNSVKGRKERIGRLIRMYADRREDIQEVLAGDIAAVLGLKDSFTGDTLCDPLIRSHWKPSPSLNRLSSVAIEPKTTADQEKMGEALQKLSEEDPTFQVHTDENTGQTIIKGMGELHLDILVDRMLREFRVQANIGKPRVAYRETITEPVHETFLQICQTIRRSWPVRSCGFQSGNG